MKRMWINQPSSLQDHHALHGTLVMAAPYNVEGYSIVYFRSGDVVSQIMPDNCLADGWPKHLQEIKP